MQGIRQLNCIARGTVSGRARSIWAKGTFPMPRHPELANIRAPLATEDDLGVQDYLDQFGEALTRGDASAIAEMWAVPAFVLGAGLAQPVMSQEQVEEFSAARAINTMNAA
jgi:hypothetical protein